MGRTFIIAAAVLVAMIAAVPLGRTGEVRTANFGELSLSYDPALWEAFDGGMRSTRGTVNRVKLRIAVDGRETCSTETELARAEAAFASWIAHDGGYLQSPPAIARPGFDVHLALFEAGCRNWTGAHTFACAAANGVVHSFTTDAGLCEASPRQDEMVLDLLGRLELR